MRSRCRGLRLDEPGLWRELRATGGGLGGGSMSAVGVVERAAAKHRDDDVEEPVRDASQRATVAVSFGSKLGVVGAAERVVLNAGAGPVVDRFAEPRVARETHRNDALLAALLGHWGHATEHAKSAIVPIQEWLPALREHRGADDRSHSRQGQKDGGIAMFAFVFFGRALVACHLLEELSHPSHACVTLLMSQAKSSQQLSEMRRAGLRHARRHV